MLVIGARDFRSNQTKSLDMVDKVGYVVMESRREGSFKFIPVKEEDAIIDRRYIMAELKDQMEGKIQPESAEALSDGLRVL